MELCFKDESIQVDGDPAALHALADMVSPGTGNVTIAGSIPESVTVAPDLSLNAGIQLIEQLVGVELV